MEKNFEGYVTTLMEPLVEYAVRALEDYENIEEESSKVFHQGYISGFHRIITLMQQHAEIYNIPLSDLGLDKIKEEDFFEFAKK